MMRNLSRHVSHFVLTIAPSAPPSRVWNLDDVESFASAENISAEAEPDFDKALTRAAALGQATLITGSFHTVGDAMARLQASPLSR
jgi:dihydrofolate synthase/folylpolyglutamate synthase